MRKQAGAIIALMFMTSLFVSAIPAYAESVPDSDTQADTSVASPVDLSPSALLILGGALVGISVLARKKVR